MPSWGKRKPEEAPQGQGRVARQAVRHSAPGGALATLSLVNAAELRELTATVFKTYPVSMLERAWPQQWQRRVDSTTNPAGANKNKPEAERADAQEQLGPPYVHVWVAFLRSLAATRGLAPEHVAVLKSYWESNVMKSAPVQLAAHVRHCRAKPCKKIEGKEGWTRIVFCLDPVTLSLEGALEAALQLQKGVRKHGPAPRGPLEREASRLLTNTIEVERLAHRVGQYTVYARLSSCIVGYWSLRWCMLS